MESTEAYPYHGAVQPKGFPALPAGWVSESETFAGSDPVSRLFAAYHHKEPLSGARALVILHGMGEHGGRYLHFPYYLQNEVDSVYCLDHVGHGRSTGNRGHIERFDQMADDAAIAVRRLDERLKKKFGKSEIHLFGHSLGGHVALRTLFLHPDLPIFSATISAPFLAIKAQVPWVKKFAARALSKVWGSLQLETGLAMSDLSRDPEVIQAYAKDRLVHGKMTPKFFEEMTVAFGDTLKRHSGIIPPVQFLVPGEDRIVDAAVTIDFFNQLRHDDKRLKSYPGCYHEPMNDLCKDQVLEDVAAWIRSHKSRGALAN